MKISIISLHPVSELISRLHDLSMLTDSDAKPYAQCQMQVTDIEPKLLVPAQRYVLRSEIEKVRRLAWGMQEVGINIFRLIDTRIRDGKVLDNKVSAGPTPVDRLGFVVFQTSEADGPITLLPPVIEVAKEANGLQTNLINDGMHRCYVARVHHVTPAVLRIEGVPDQYPYYAFPNVSGWDDVALVDTIGVKLIKKFHRVPNYQKLYRNFNSVFENVGGPRGRAVAKIASNAAEPQPATA